ncbi:hypothetical protein SLE2022_351320 [Rubroshorea leprosula]
MEQSPENNSQHVREPLSLSSSSSIGDSPSTSQVQGGGSNEEQPQNHQEQQQQAPRVSYRVNISISDVGGREIGDDVWSCIFVLVTFWFFASMTLILGFYGSVTLQLGPNDSRLLQTNRFFVQSVKVEEIGEHNPGIMLYGFHKKPLLDIDISWTEIHETMVPLDFHKEWLYFLNKGSEVNISYSVKSSGSSPLSLVIAQGRENFLEWLEDPSHPNTTLSWNIIYGHGKIQQRIPTSSDYYIAVINFNPEEVQIELKFSFKALIYNTVGAYSTCTLSNHLCNLNLHLLGTYAVVLSSSGLDEGTPDSNRYVKVSYGPRWITYFAGSALMTILILCTIRFCNVFRTPSTDGTGLRVEEMISERTPLLQPKDDDVSSWGSSYDSISHDEEDLEEWLAANSVEIPKEGESNNPPRLCVVCFDAPRDCFFLPCGHCATCFTCGTRIAEDAGTCPICRRKMKKVRKIFSV